MELHPEYLIKNGKKEFVVLTIEEYDKVKQMLLDYEDLIDLRQAKELEKDTPAVSLEEAKKEILG